MNSIDLAQKIHICDVIKTPSVQTWFAYFFVSVQHLSTNFGAGRLEHDGSAQEQNVYEEIRVEIKTEEKTLGRVGISLFRSKRMKKIEKFCCEKKKMRERCENAKNSIRRDGGSFEHAKVRAGF